jgi:hypothetical protein
MNEWNFFAWSSLGNLIMVLPLMANMGVRKETLNFLGNRTMALGALFSEEAFHFLGVICSIFALALGSVSLVTSVEALQPFTTLISVVVISLFKPGCLTKI